MAKAWDVEIEIVEQKGRCPNGHKVGEKFLSSGRGDQASDSDQM